MSWVPVELASPQEGEDIRALLQSGKETTLIYREGEWLDPRYLPMRVEFLNVTHWRPIGGH